MEIPLIYLIKVSTALLLFYPFYVLVLRKHTFYNMNRAFLLGSLMLCFIFPLLSLPGKSSITPSGITQVLGEVTILANRAVNQPIIQHTSILSWLSVIYFTGLLVLLVLFLQNMMRIFKLKSKAEIVEIDGVRVFIVNKSISSFSFGSWIFIDRDNYSADQDLVVLKHELAHVRQFHTLDLVLTEIVRAVLWFHPVVWLYKRFVQEIHEYLADDAVISHGTEAGNYMELLFKQTCDIHPIPISNHFNQSLIKRRFTMITKAKSGKYTAIRIAILLPLITAICFVVVNMLSFPVFSQKQQLTFVPVNTTSKTGEPQKKKEAYTVVEKMPEYIGGYEVLQKYIASEVKYPETAKKWGICADVYIGFIVNTEGRIVSPEVRKINSSYADEKAKKAPTEVYGQAVKDMEAEALRVISNAPGKWTPGEQKGKKVDVEYTIPIRFKLK